jgi:hypothetical protein
MVGFFMLKVVMARGKLLKKRGGSLEVHQQNATSSNQVIGEQNITSSDQVIVWEIVVSLDQAIAKQIVVSLD